MAVHLHAAARNDHRRGFLLLDDRGDLALRIAHDPPIAGRVGQFGGQHRQLVPGRQQLAQGLAADQRHIAIEHQHAGIIGYLLKPIKAAELLAVTARMKSSLTLEERIAALLNEQQPSRSVHPLVSRVITHLEENMADPSLNLNDVAAQCFVSAGHLGRLIKQETGMTFVEYLTHLRIERAKKLLLETDVAAYEVGEQVGVEDAHYFGLLFKKNVGMTISEFRKE